MRGIVKEVRKTDTHKVCIDTDKNVYTIDGKDFGNKCVGAEIKITPGDLPEVILHFATDVDFTSESCKVQALNDKEMIS